MHSIAGFLQQINPQWDGDRLFQETRKIVGAEVQHVTYKEYLPKLLGRFMNERIGAYTGYDASVNPSVANEFVSAAFRVGHGMLQARTVP